jgi:hypothetical protein
MNTQAAFKEFTNRFKLLISKHPDLITMTLSNIFTMRLIGNKTHGDLAEIAIAEFVNQYMDDFHSDHVGKNLYRAKSKEEDITVINEITKVKFPVSLKAYGDGPLQLSTNKDMQMFRTLSEADPIDSPEKIKAIFDHEAFSSFTEINVLPLIYDEKQQRCNILVFDYDKALTQTATIIRRSEGRGRIHPVFVFLDSEGGYICEVRYGGADNNALQRGLWTNTRKSLTLFDSITGGWIDYSHNLILVKLFSHALVSSSAGHELALEKVKEDILALKRRSGI